MRWICRVGLAGALAIAQAASAAEPPRGSAASVTPPILFESTAGQASSAPPFTAHLRNGQVDLLRDGFRMRDGVRVRFLGGNRNVVPQAVDLVAARANYFVGSDPRRWRVAVPQYERVRYAQLYPGIDVVFHATDGSLEYDFDVAAGADSTRIALEVRGADRLSVDAAGDLVVQAGAHTLRQHRPVAYQDIDGGRRSVDARYQIARGRVRIALGPYDRRRRLVIDPSLVYSTFVGGASDDGYSFGVTGAAVNVDASGAAYAAISYRGSSTNTDVFIAKFAAGTHALVYSTMLGGTNEDHAYDIAVAPDGSVYVTGDTASGDFPFLNAYQQGTPAPSAPFLLRLNPDGTLAFATLFSMWGLGRAVIAAPDGSAFWSGQTRDATMFTSAGALQPTYAGGADAFVARFSAAGSPVTSTFLGGSGADITTALALGQDGAIYVGGTTTSTNLPTTTGAFQTTPGRRDCIQYVFTFPCQDAVVAKLSSDETQLGYLTYLRETDTTNVDPVDQIAGIAVNAGGEAYVTGSTTSRSFPSTAGAYDTTCGTPAAPCYMGLVTHDLTPYTDVFVTKLNATGTALVYSTFLGGIQPSPARLGFVDHAAQGGAAIRLDAAGRATVTGFTNATDFPLVAAIQPTLLGSSDAFVSRFSADGRSLELSTYLGGGSTRISGLGGFDLEGALALALGPGGDVWVAGHTYSADFPVTPDAYQPTAGGESDAFVTAINVSDPALVIDLPVDGSLTAPINVQGWAIDRASAVGSGIDAIHVYVWPNPGSGTAPLFLGAAVSTRIPRPDVAAIFGPQFRDSGYSVGACCLNAGVYLLAVYGHSSITNSFSVVATRTITIHSQPTLTVDIPTNGATVRAPLLVAGWAIDLGAPSGTGIDAIHVWGYPNPGSGAPPIFFGALSQFDPGIYRPRPDVGAIFGSQFTNSGYEMLLRPPPGTYLLAVYGHSTVTNDFTVVRTLQVTVEANPMMAVDQPSAGGVVLPFTISGWAIDYAAPAGTGTDAVHVWAYPNPGSGAPPVFVGVATYGAVRADVGAAFGDARFTPSGYSMNVSDLAPAPYDLVVFTHGTVTNSFSNYRVVHIEVP